MMQETTSEKFPIRTVAEVTGVNAVTLRAWERRYGLIKPLRTPKGHRVYTRDHIQLIQEILDRLSLGMSIGQVARDILNTSVGESGANVWEQYSRRMSDAIVNFDHHALDSVYNDAMSLYPVDVVTTNLIMPLLEELGSRWETKAGSVAEEHFFSVYLRNKLGARFHHQNIKSTGPKLILACLPGEQHEFGILLFALTAHSKGYQIILLGADLPVAELKHVADRTESKGIVLAGSAALGCDAAVRAVGLLTEQVGIPLFIGGGISSTCRHEIVQAGATPLGHDLAGSLHIIANKLNQSN
jgi:DNA-binding transcriptional MerR regulator